MILGGTLLNALTVLLGGIFGTLLGNRLPERYQRIILQSLSLTTILFSIQMMSSTKNALIPLGALMLGALTGEWLRLEQRLEQLGNWLQATTARRLGQQVEADPDAPPRRGLATISQAFITTSLVFCVGPLTILGSIQNGINPNDIQLLALKSTLDGFAAIAFAASLGFGVLFTVVTILIVQGGISLLAGVVGSGLLTTLQVNEMTAVGGLTVLAVALKLLEIKQLPVANFLPALLYAPLLVAILQAVGVKIG